VKGTSGAVEALTRERLVGLHARRFAPSELTVVVVGDVPAGRAIEVAARTFEGWDVPPP
jgi:predicted Zn-dependent peptidase